MPESPLAPHVASAAELQDRYAAARGETPYLVLREGGGPQRLVLLGPGVERLTIGRGTGNDIPLPWDDRASRLHAELERVGGEWVVVDDGLSTNGTWVGDTRIVGRRRLRDGDLLRVGNTVIAFCAPGQVQAGTALADDIGSAVQVTPAQRRVLVALCRPSLTSGGRGVPLTNSELAGELYLSVDAIKTHLKALFHAFGLDAVPNSQKRAALVERAIGIGLVTARDDV
ncbi:MAG TPA: FHA domain-containing protein [Solirubrobacteraceae bacterium]|nr:FHA domain-containing protein [Solirubrobacteraceae bacterium]